ncbi:MAG: aspartate/glutamate racemase family protein [Chloroflexi bacterium]|nr:aspartate/glutamate racemase family protein [Chloroflexota bacterium]
MRSYATAETQIDAEYMPGISGFSPWGGRGNESLERHTGLKRAGELSAELAVRAERDGYDAFCPYGTLDIGVREARARVRIPVVGQAEACMLFCGMLDQPFASCMYMPGNEEMVHGWTREARVDHLHAGHTAIGIPNSEYPHRRTEVLQEFARCAGEAQAKGAQLMGLIAMSICPGEFPARELSEAAGGFPVLDALACQIAMAEWWHRTGLPPTLLKMPRA